MFHKSFWICLLVKVRGLPNRGWACDGKSKVRGGAWLRGSLVSVAAGPAGAEPLPNELEPLIEKLMQQQQIPGLAIAIVEDNRIVYARGFGVKNFDKKTKMPRLHHSHSFTWHRLQRRLWPHRSCNL